MTETDGDRVSTEKRACMRAGREVCGDNVILLQTAVAAEI